MIDTLLTRLRRILSKLVTRVILIAALALLALFSSAIIGHYIPDWVIDYIGIDSLDTILRTLAATMLTVTTFSLSVMTSAFQAASSQISPRARQILRADGTVHGVLATFVGAFLFALIGIVLRATPLLGKKESAILFLFTIVVVALVVIEIIRWINHIEGLGALDATLGALQKQATVTIENYSNAPALGARPVEGLDTDVGRAPFVPSPRDGYVEVIYFHDLQTAAERLGAQIVLAVRPGDYVTKGAPLLHVIDDDLPPAAHEPEAMKDIDNAITIGNIRNYEQDPRFCLSSITEIATRALSPGVNDPQTAIDVTHRLTALLRRADPDDHAAHPAPKYPRVALAPLKIETLYRLSLDVVAHYAKDAPEVNIALDQALRSLAARSGPAGRAAAEGRLSACSDAVG
ncbi:DUF2254 domain-containing protein [Rhodalgimonas zhirmunskyi]|uniref:DUF2254 domain-containing protein n=1 Tax=Rhodalgimonas zhirmunskyi TaxID=2964767 RepID=A0AAJ1U2Z0_9RHOB|nr:DUF2254 domain-containing protein [Rhodoalgimonas zhirmunskyi]MDQ2092731.1 DUF2254 domain-containing protein [Rhodoalgimonas zhirmunskyi]